MNCESSEPQISAIADSYVSSPPVPHQTTDMIAVRCDFLNAFFDGFTSPGAQMSTHNNAAYYGFLAGHEYHSKFPDKEEEVMRSFGFEVVSVEGRLFFGDEGGFSPHCDPAARWEIADVAFRTNNGWPPKSRRRDGMPAILKGYLSPERYYGQRFNGDRKLYVLQAVVLSQ